MENQIFNNLLASRPSRERRWRVWLIVAIVHVVAISAFVLYPNESRSDEVIEIYHEPIILDDQPPEFKPLPEADIKAAESGPASPGPDRAR